MHSPSTRPAKPAQAAPATLSQPATTASRAASTDTSTAADTRAADFDIDLTDAHFPDQLGGAA